MEMTTTTYAGALDLRALPPSTLDLGTTRDGGRVGKNAPSSPSEFFVNGKLTGPELRMLWCESCGRPVGRFASGPGQVEVKCKGCSKYTSRIAL
jgi:hypothetical protein